MKFLCLAYGAERDWKALSKAEQDVLLAQDEVIRRRGGITSAVGPPTTVRNWKGAALETRAGPFASAPVPLAGFGLIEARDLDEAIALVSKTPCAVARGAVEIWPLVETPEP